MKFDYLPIISVATIISGGTPKTSMSEYWNGNIPWLSVKDFNNGSKFVYSTEKHITELGLKNSSTNLLRANDIIISARGTVGEMAMIPFDMAFNQSCFGIRANIEKILPDYLYYALKNNIQTIKSSTHGSVFDTITLKDFEVIKISVPDLETQQKIVRILSALDSKIELNNQINDNLHSVQKNIYEDWFIINKHSDWREDKLGNYLSIERGLSYKGQFLSDTGTPMINLGNVMPDGFFRMEKNKYYTGDYTEKVSAKIGDIVIANTDMTQNREVIGTPVIIPPIYDSNIIYSHHIYGVKNLKLPRIYIFYSLLRKEFRAIAGGNATGTTVLFLPKDSIENYKITIPDEQTLVRYTRLSEMIHSRREEIILENIKLAQLRDTLLPKLMNGEIDLG